MLPLVFALFRLLLFFHPEAVLHKLGVLFRVDDRDSVAVIVAAEGFCPVCAERVGSMQTELRRMQLLREVEGEPALNQQANCCFAGEALHRKKIFCHANRKADAEVPITRLVCDAKVVRNPIGPRIHFPIFNCQVAIIHEHPARHSHTAAGEHLVGPLCKQLLNAAVNVGVARHRTIPICRETRFNDPVEAGIAVCAADLLKQLPVLFGIEPVLQGCDLTQALSDDLFVDYRPGCVLKNRIGAFCFSVRARYITYTKDYRTLEYLPDQV